MAIYFNNTMHLEYKGMYDCNRRTNANKEKMTTDKSKVTCINCLRRMKQYENKQKNQDQKETDRIKELNKLRESIGWPPL